MGLPRLCEVLNEIVLLKYCSIIPKTEQTHFESLLMLMLVPDSVFSISEIMEKRDTETQREGGKEKERVEIEKKTKYRFPYQDI